MGKTDKKDKKNRKTDGGKTNDRPAAAAALAEPSAEAGAARKRLSREVYEAELARLQGDLVQLQRWIQTTGARIVVVFEGRDAAGKGGLIKALTDRVSPRIFRVVALPAPTDRERTQIYLQRFIAHFPAAGEITIFDRSWYNRAGVERVMGFCSDEQYERFLRVCPDWEHDFIESGLMLVKYWLEVDKEEQTRRFTSRINDPRKTWKLSPMDLESHRRWYDYSRARDAMLAATHTPKSPWHIIDGNDKRRARLNCIAHFLSLIPFERTKDETVKLPKRQEPDGYVEADTEHLKVTPRY